jgi:hypothetical protein
VAVIGKEGTFENTERVRHYTACFDATQPEYRLLANMGWFYTRLVGFYSRPPLALSQAGTIDRRNLSERTPLMPEQAFDQLQTSVKEFQAMCVIREDEV